MIVNRTGLLVVRGSKEGHSFIYALLSFLFLFSFELILVLIKIRVSAGQGQYQLYFRDEDFVLILHENDNRLLFEMLQMALTVSAKENRLAT